MLLRPASHATPPGPATARPQISAARQLLRWLVAALALAQVLTAQAALAQQRQPGTKPRQHTAPKPPASPANKPRSRPDLTECFATETPDTAKTYTYVEQMPEAPGGGGMGGIVSYFQRNLRLSRQDIDGSEVPGKVMVKFTISKTGAIIQTRIVKSSGNSGVDAAVLRAVYAMKGLRPGRQNGVPVKVEIILPINCFLPQ